MAIAAIVLALIVVGIFIWEPWSRATLFGGDVKVEYHEWDVGGDAGRKIIFDFKRSGVYDVTISAPTCIACEFKNEKHTFKLLENCTKKELDLSTPYPDYFEVTILRNGSEPETCKVRKLF